MENLMSNGQQPRHRRARRHDIPVAERRVTSAGGRTVTLRFHDADAIEDMSGHTADHPIELPATDGKTHLVTPDALAAGREVGVYDTLCGDRAPTAGVAARNANYCGLCRVPSTTAVIIPAPRLASEPRVRRW